VLVSEVLVSEVLVSEVLVSEVLVSEVLVSEVLVSEVLVSEVLVSSSIRFKVYPCSCIQMDTKTWIPYISFVHKYIYARIEINTKE
jgi:hypothetical protein